MDRRCRTPYLCAMMEDDILDATGLLCPLPVLKARKRLKAMASGQMLRVLATDPAAVIDMPHFCRESGNLLLAVDALPEGVHAYVIRKS